MTHTQVDPTKPVNLSMLEPYNMRGLIVISSGDHKTTTTLPICSSKLVPAC
jgi:hypothetical protein